MSTASILDYPFNNPNSWPSVDLEQLQHMNPSIDPNMFKPSITTSYPPATLYLLFGGLEYYAKGGWNDYIDNFGSLDAAKEEGFKKIKNETIDWFHVVDTTGKFIIFEEGKAFNYLENKTL